MWTLQPLLTKTAEGFTGPMSPVLFAEHACKEFQQRFDGLCRVWFRNDDEMHQHNEGTRLQPSYTGHDTLVILTKFKNCNQYTMFIDGGIGGVPAFLGFSDQDSVTRTPIYDSMNYLKTLTDEQALQIFKEIEEKNLCEPIEPKKAELIKDAGTN